ncbi:hypothetical protein LCGC14_0537160 [marine sediment metagenome]|uniref:Uncharacterized protein n=1 Tax=marine sediment metagenome TaxID=412755 RepID=A0A0F9UFF7_9ZZZZ
MKTEITLNQLIDFLNGFKPDFIDQVWKDDKHLVEHLNKKWVGICRQLDTNPTPQTSHIQTFISQLDNKNRELLANYIKKTY